MNQLSASSPDNLTVKGSEEHLLRGQLCEQRQLKHFSENISRHSPVSTLLLSCVPGIKVKRSEAGQPSLKKTRGEVDDLLGAVPKLSLCPLTRSAIGLCSTIIGRRGWPKFAETMFRGRFRKFLGLTHSLLPANKWHAI